MRFRKKSKILFNFMLLIVNHFSSRWSVTKIIFHQFFDSIFSWKNFFVKFMNENISKSFNEKNIMFCSKKKYALKYSFVFMRLKFIIIFDFSLFYITKTKNKIDETMFKNSFCMRSFFTNGFNISFIAQRSRADKK